MNASPGFRPISALLSEALDTASELALSEASLARADAEASLRRAGVGLALSGIGLALLAVAVNLLAGAAVAMLLALYPALGPAGAATIVAVATLLIAALLIVAGSRALKSITFTPRRMAENLRRDARILTEALKDD